MLKRLIWTLLVVALASAAHAQSADTILLNGKPIGSAGPKGQVRTLQLTSGGFQIVPPKPAAPAAPLDPLDR